MSQLAKIALDHEFESDVRREALKAMLAIGKTERYKELLKPLRNNLIESRDVIASFVAVNDSILAPPLFEYAARDDLMSRVQQKAILAFLSIWDQESTEISYSAWKGKPVYAGLEDIESRSTGRRKKAAKSLMDRIQ